MFKLNKKYIMGILNVTPDSFYDGGKFNKVENAFQHALDMYNTGADIIDIGGESTRPDAESVSLQEELDRVCPVVNKIKLNIDIKISIDTSKSIVANECLKLGADIINDISGLKFDSKIAGVAAKYNCYIVLMHMKGTPQNMQNNVKYNDLIKEIKNFLKSATDKAIMAGIKKEKIILDPGIGFGKSLEDNYRIINNIHLIKDPGFPVLIGLSRKSLIGKLYQDQIDRLPATIALNTVAILNGADIIRVHDVKEHRLALDSLQMLNKVS